jgi:thymidylate kinase
MRRPALLFCFTGIDGSGKTTQAKLLVDWLASKGVKSIYAWSRGEVRAIRGLLLFLGRRALGTSERDISRDGKSYREYQSRKSKLMERSPVRTLWSAMTYAEHLIQINRDIRRKLRAGYVVVCDRYLWDSTIDMAVLNNKAPEWLSNRLNRFMWKLVPRPAITFFVDIPAEEALKRKGDIPSHEYVRKRAECYRYLAKCHALTAIDGCRDVATIQNEIIDTVTPYI